MMFLTSRLYCFTRCHFKALCALRLPGLRTQALAPMQAALMAAKTDKTAMQKAAKKAEAILREMVGITLNTSLTRIQRTNLETCITVHMHQKEISGRNHRVMIAFRAL